MIKLQIRLGTGGKSTASFRPGDAVLVAVPVVGGALALEVAALVAAEVRPGVAVGLLPALLLAFLRRVDAALLPHRPPADGPTHLVAVAAPVLNLQGCKNKRRKYSILWRLMLVS